jgi:hypothetical protein
MSILSVSEVKTLLQISANTYDALLAVLIPMVEDDLFNITQNYFTSEIVRYTSNYLIFATTGKTITDSTSIDFADYGFVAAQVVRITGSQNNNKTITLLTVLDNVLTASASDSFVNEDMQNNDSTSYEVTIAKVDYPEGLKLCFSKMCGDQIKAQSFSDTFASPKSESIGDHSISYGADLQSWVEKGYSLSTINMLKPYCKNKIEFSRAYTNKNTNSFNWDV